MEFKDPSLTRKHHTGKAGKATRTIIVSLFNSLHCLRKLYLSISKFSFPVCNVFRFHSIFVFLVWFCEYFHYYLFHRYSFRFEGRQFPRRNGELPVTRSFLNLGRKSGNAHFRTSSDKLLHCDSKYLLIIIIKYFITFVERKSRSSLGIIIGQSDGRLIDWAELAL